MFTVYKVSAKTTDKSYYGYVKAEDVDSIKAAFVTQASRGGERGDSKLLNLAGSADELQVQIMDAFDNEEESLVIRNDLRAADVFAVTGPSQFPFVGRQLRGDELTSRASKIEKLRNEMLQKHIGNFVKSGQGKVGNIIRVEKNKKQIDFIVQWPDKETTHDLAGITLMRERFLNV